MRRFFASLLAVAGFMAIALTPVASAMTLTECADSGLTSAQCKAVSENRLNYKGDNVIWDIVRFILMALGGVAVIMIIVGGIQYATSQGESATLTKAKNTILYSVIGLVVALSATAIITLVINTFTK